LTKSHEIALGLGFLVLFLGTLIVGAHWWDAVARKLIKTAGIQWFDRFLGGIFGLVRGVLVDAILRDGHGGLRDQAGRRAAVGPGALRDHRNARAIALVMPANLRAQFHLGFEKFRESARSDRQASGPTLSCELAANPLDRSTCCERPTRIPH
jgi:hypothetical protein